MARSTGGRLDLLRQGGPPGAEDRPAPGDPDRAVDGFAPSRHSRLEVAPPEQEPCDAARAEAYCAELARGVLGDFAVGLPLLGSAGRRRAQVLAAWSFTLFDLAGQPGFEGGKLAAINRWEFDLESALDGGSQTQPIFAALSHEHRRDPWPVAAFDALIDLARRQASTSLPTGGPRREAQHRALAAALAHAYFGEAAPDETVSLLTAVLAAGDGRARSGLPQAEQLALLRGLRPQSHGSRPHRRAFSFLRGAGLVLLNRQDARPNSGHRRALHLSFGTRLRLLLRALFA